MNSDLGQWDSGLSLTEELARTWNDDIIWWGPESIGATYTIERYAQQHSGPFRAAFSERSKQTISVAWPKAISADFFEWLNFSTVPAGVFMGMPATGSAGEFRVIDI
ncbi:hypothetical protein [Ruegeria sp. Ofav3-42]|uniref:hypothetical protein n=1 Tax=Ruegeria sp. Ofav3-42 TaxID=2917759 RepID=UPI00351D2FB7